MPLAGLGYRDDDLFYQANGSYSFIQTCNTWLGTGLRQAGIKISYWTPLDTFVTWYMKKSVP